MRAKVAQEKLIKGSSIPYTILRATQFFEFVGRIADEATSGQTVRLPSVLFQPILSDDLATALTRAGLSVTRQARFARYSIQAEIRQSGAHKRLLLHLTDQESGRQLWAHRSEGVLNGGSAFHERLASRIVAGLTPTLRRAEIEHARSKPDGALSPHDLALRAMPGVLSLDADGNARALDLLERALDLDPDSPLATALAAWAYAQRIVYHLSADPMAERVRGLELAPQAKRAALPSRPGHRAAAPSH